MPITILVGLPFGFALGGWQSNRRLSQDRSISGGSYAALCPANEVSSIELELPQRNLKLGEAAEEPKFSMVRELETLRGASVHH